MSGHAEPVLCFVFGGARSGKSAYAEARTETLGARPLYLATAEPRDGEMAERIAHHRERRGTHWQTVEEPIDLSPVFQREAASDRPILVDCLTLWLSNLMGADKQLRPAFDELLTSLDERRGPIVLVSNDVGSGVVPMNALARRFVDEAGRLHQHVARLATEVVLVQVGLPLVLKGIPPELPASPQPKSL